MKKKLSQHRNFYPLVILLFVFILLWSIFSFIIPKYSSEQILRIEQKRNYQSGETLLYVSDEMCNIFTQRSVPIGCPWQPDTIFLYLAYFEDYVLVQDPRSSCIKKVSFGSLQVSKDIFPDESYSQVYALRIRVMHPGTCFFEDEMYPYYEKDKDQIVLLDQRGNQVTVSKLLLRTQ